MGKVMRHTLGASLNIRHNLSSSKGPKPLQLKLLTTYIPKTSAFRSEERFSRNAETDLVCRLLLEKKNLLFLSFLTNFSFLNKIDSVLIPIEFNSLSFYRVRF